MFVNNVFDFGIMFKQLHGRRFAEWHKIKDSGGIGRAERGLYSTETNELELGCRYEKCNVIKLGDQEL